MSNYIKVLQEIQKPPALLQRSVFEEFLSTPHSCFMTEDSPSCCPQILDIGFLKNAARCLIENGEDINWFDGTELNSFISLTDRKSSWKYAVIPLADISPNRVSFVLLCMSVPFKYTNLIC